MIAGGGATELDHFIDPGFFAKSMKHFKANNNHSEVLHKFTFASVEIKRDGWHISVIDQDATTEKKKFLVKSQ